MALYGQKVFGSGYYGDPQEGLDSYIYGSTNDEDTNFGARKTLRCGWIGSGEIGDRGALRPILEFDISEIPPNSTIRTAQLAIYVESTNPFVAYVRRQLQPAWVENECTWNVAYTGANGWDDNGLKGGWFTTEDQQVFSAPGAGLPDLKIISGEGLVGQCQYALNHLNWRVMMGMIKHTESGAIDEFRFSSNDAIDADLRPVLTVQYTPPGSRGNLYRKTSSRAYWSSRASKMLRASG